jgi:hypothetical protein
MSSVPVVGEIYNPPGYLPPFTQPGGPGSPTYPQQSVGELTAFWIGPFCGHGFNELILYSTTVAGVQTAVLCCPVCNMCFRLIAPYNQIYAESNWILFP